nr:transposase [uncultured Desulfobulbus sp.]
MIDRASKAIHPHYEAIGEKAHAARGNHVDETPWKNNGKLNWLWVMASSVVAYFMVHTHRSKDAFASLVGVWEGILVSDGYRLYQNWVHARQTCLAHLIRRAKDPPTKVEWNAFYARLNRLIAQYIDSDSEAGKLVRHLDTEMGSLFTFLLEEGVDPTNNFGERMLRYAILWRKRSQGTSSDKGSRWVERIVSLRQTCRLQGKSSCHVLVDAMDAFFKDQQPDLEWIRAAT